MTTKIEFTKNAIVEVVSELTDERLLDYLYSMIMAALVAETHQEAC
jgi:hypothetical protein